MIFTARHAQRSKAIARSSCGARNAGKKYNATSPIAESTSKDSLSILHIDPISPNLIVPSHMRRPCQVSDWKARHKFICGKSITSVEEAMRMSRPKSLISASNDGQFGPPRNGFKRTPQLIKHIRELDQRPYVDFIVRVNANGVTRDVQNNYPAIRELFRAARQAAMVDGNREAMAEMCHYLIWYLRAKMADFQDCWDLNCVVDQMEKEFEYPDLRQAMREMQDRQWADRLKRP